MSFLKKLKNRIPTLSYEFFPPKNTAGWGTLYGTISEISQLNPDFISVTYGAGGSTREKTVDLVSRFKSELALDTMAHLTCVGHSKSQIEEILTKLSQQGIRNILALRGDPPKGTKEFVSHPDGFKYATDLISFIKKNFNFNIGCAFYPETHPEAISALKDLEFLKMKQDLGVNFAVSQMFFDNTLFYQFRDRAEKIGLNIPLVAGIMPITLPGQAQKFVQLSGCSLPTEAIECSQSSDPQTVLLKGVEFAEKQCSDLLHNGISGIHLYTLNRSQASSQITDRLRKRGFFQTH